MADAARDTSSNRSVVVAFAITVGFLILPTLCCSGWFFFDGFATYPAENERYEVYRQYEKNGDLTGWQRHAAEQGWSTDVPQRRSPSAQLAQKILGGICAFMALVLIVVTFILSRLARKSRDQPLPHPADMEEAG